MGGRLMTRGSLPAASTQLILTLTGVGMDTSVVAGIVGGLGAAVGAIVVQRWRVGVHDRIFKALDEQGAEAARALLDGAIPPVTTISLLNTMRQRQRMAALAALDDRKALERERETHTGSLAFVAQVDGLALLGLAVREEKPAPRVEELDVLATRLEKEGGATAAWPKKAVRALADLAAGLRTGEAPDTSPLSALDQMISEGGAVAVLLRHALALVAERAGDEARAAELTKLVRARTRAFGTRKKPSKTTRRKKRSE